MSLTKEQNLQTYEETVRNGIPDKLDVLSALYFCGAYPDRKDWAIGPFVGMSGMAFRKDRQWRDPLQFGWNSSSIFNPSLIMDGDRLLMFYRAAPHKESLSSRIGLAWMESDGRWVDSPLNPILYPTEANELLGCEDPKIYFFNQRFHLFYNAVWRPSRDIQERYRSAVFPIKNAAVDICLATSSDLRQWSKHGLVVPREISHYHAKGAVIPRDARGMPVPFGDKFLMFVSEGCGGQQHIGYSTDLLKWKFEPVTYLKLDPAFGRLEEVACAVCPDEAGDCFVLDFYYKKADGTMAGAQALYSRRDPAHQLDLNEGGTLSWGGLIRWRDHWMYAQGWDAEPGREEIQFYRS